jgi:hypothetical protein
MNKATQHMNRTLLKYNRNPGVRLFRNNVGLAWAGVMIARIREAITLRDPRPIKFGLHPGSGDLIGWQSVEITPEMVGRKVAVFLSVECKFGTGRESAAQKNWRKRVTEAGGIAFVEREGKRNPDKV